MTTTITRETKSFRMVSMPSAQCHVDITVNYHTNAIERVSLVSYATEVLRLVPDADGLHYNLWCSGTYSATTARHINRFTTEFCGTNMYFECKNALKMRPSGCYDSFVGVAPVDACAVINHAYGYLENTMMHEVKHFYGKY